MAQKVGNTSAIHFLQVSRNMVEGKNKTMKSRQTYANCEIDFVSKNVFVGCQFSKTKAAGGRKRQVPSL